MEYSSLCGTSKSEGKNSEAISDSITSLGDHNSTDNVSSTGQSDNLQNNEGDKTDNTTDVQKIPVEGHDIKEDEDKEEDEEEEEDSISEGELLVQMGYAKSEPGEEIRKELERKSSDDEESREDDDNEPQGPITASMADLKLVSSLKGSRKSEGKPPKVVTWSQNLEEFAPSEDETETSHYQVKGAGKSKQMGGSKSAGEGGSKSNGRGGRKGAGKNKKKGKKHGGSSSKWSNYGE